MQGFLLEKAIKLLYFRVKDYCVCPRILLCLAMNTVVFGREHNCIFLEKKNGDRMPPYLFSYLYKYTYI